MMITEMIKKAFILDEMKAQGKREALKELAGAFTAGRVQFDPDAMLQVLLEREKLGSTGIGDGIAIPHGKLVGLEEIVVAFGRSRTGVAFEAMDGKPVHLFFLLMAPEHSAGLHLKALAKISRMLKDVEFRQQLMAADTAEGLMQVIAAKDETL